MNKTIESLSVLDIDMHAEASIEAEKEAWKKHTNTKESMSQKQIELAHTIMTACKELHALRPNPDTPFGWLQNDETGEYLLYAPNSYGANQIKALVEDIL